MRAALVAMIVVVAVGATNAQAQERIYIGNDDHTDYFWSLDDNGYRQAFQDMIAFYLDQAEATSTNPVNERGRFNLDGSLWVYEWEHNQPADQMTRLMQHVAAGDISLPLHSLVLLGGAMPTEAVIRDMMYAGRLERRFPGVHVELVDMMENQTLAGGLASLWAGAGAKYSWRGICNCGTKIAGASTRPDEIYRFVGHDGRGVLLKWNSFVSDNRSIGGYAEAFDPISAVDVMENNALYASRWPFPVKAAFGFGWDAPATTTTALIDAAHSLTDAQHTVIVSNEHDFFEDFTATVDVSTLPAFTGSFGNEWDLYTASLANPTALMRTSIEKLRTAEGLAVIVAHEDPTFLDGRFDGTDEARELAQLQMGMFYDHDWTADSSLHDKRAQFERDTAANVAAYVDTLHDDALARLSTLVPASTDPNKRRFVVANALAFFNQGIVELPGVVDEFTAFDVGQQQPLPSQVITAPDGSKHGVISLFAPAVGFTVVEVTSGAPSPPLPHACAITHNADGSVTMNDTHVILTVGIDGSITSLVNLHDNNELAGRGLFSLGNGGPSNTIDVEEDGPVLCRVSVDLETSPPHTARYTLAALDRVDVEETITGGFADTEGYVVDLTGIPGAVIHHEETGEIALAKRVSHGGDYADSKARTDFLTLNHFVDASNDVFGFSISSSESAFMKVGTSDVATLDENPSSLLLVVGMQPDAPLGFANQGGDGKFVNHYSIFPHDSGYDGLLALSTALSTQNPPVAVLAAGAPDAAYAGRDLVKLVNVAGVVPWWIKPADDGASAGVIVRLWNSATTSTPLIARGTFTAASRVTHLENDDAAGAFAQPTLSGEGFRDTLATDELATYRVFLADASNVVDAGVIDVDGGGTTNDDAGTNDVDAGANDVDGGAGHLYGGEHAGCACSAAVQERTACAPGVLACFGLAFHLRRRRRSTRLQVCPTTRTPPTESRSDAASSPS